MARKIIILAQRGGPGKDTEIDAAFWLDVVVASRRQFYAKPNAVSRVPGVTAPELSALQTGAVTETVQTYSRPQGATNAQIKTYLEGQLTILQAALTADDTYRFALTSFDGTTWTNVDNS